MTSTSMLNGDKRWTSRRGGMTVLGKVAVPKPLNLPSQKLENHGKDPNVEIVPRGTCSWGSSRSSSSASNPWVCSTLSPNTDGSNGSPSHQSARPSSGGSGTRPSSAGSDRVHEPTASAWGANSRPSSASGALASNQTSQTTLRPHSAETRPGSSQLSRFAGPSADNSAAWGAAGFVEKLGVTSARIDGFSLSSGDFPTLGSEKDNSGKNSESQDGGSDGCPSSSSGRVASEKDRNVASQADLKNGNANSWNRDESQHIGDGVHPSPDKWQEDPHQYLNANIPQHFDAWHGVPLGAPSGAWYRGPSRRSPYGTPVAPGGFPMEPFHYYPPQMPPAALASPQPMPPPGAGPRGHHPKNGDLYRPQIPDAYIHPGMAIRPGFYPRPLPYENYFGPPITYCGPNEQDIPFRGMSVGPHVYSRFPTPNVHDPSNAHFRAGGHDFTSKMRLQEQAELGEDNQGQYKVLLKQQNEWEGKEDADNWGHPEPTDTSFCEKSDKPRTLPKKNEWGADSRGDEMYSRKIISSEKSSVQISDNQGDHSLDSVKIQSHENVGNLEASTDSREKNSEKSAFPASEIHQEVVALKDSTLIQKIEGLNAKARGSDGWDEFGSSYRREEQTNKFQSFTVKVTGGGGCASDSVLPTSLEMSIPIGDDASEPEVASGTVISRLANHGTHRRFDQRGKGRYINQDAEWQKKPLAAESSGAVGDEAASNFHGPDHHTSMGTSENPQTSTERKDESESLAPISDPSDSQAQRAKMRELAKQRAVQLQKEEEERTREQKAKALAKLEELNRRTQMGDGSILNLEKPPPTGSIIQEQDKSETSAELVMGAKKCEASDGNLLSNPGVVESYTCEIGDFVLEMPKDSRQGQLLLHSTQLLLKQDVQDAGAADSTTTPRVSDGGASRHKRMGYKQKQNSASENFFTERSNPMSTTVAATIQTNVAAKDTATEVVTNEFGLSGESSLPSNANMVTQSSAYHRKKNNRNGKNKHQLDETPNVSPLPSLAICETHPPKSSIGSGRLESSQSESDTPSAQSVVDAKVATHPSEQHSSIPSEETHGRLNSHRKAQHPRRMPKNQQANRQTDKYYSNDAVVWAPVRSQNKADAVDEANQKPLLDAVIPKSDSLIQNNMKSKRAELERYVPKQVAKELAQQGSQQTMSSSLGQSTLDETAGRADPGCQPSESSQPVSSVESRNWDGKQNKQAKSHGAWRQRGSTESCVLGLQHGTSTTSEASINGQKYMDQDKSSKPDKKTVKTSQKLSDKGNTLNDGWDTTNTCDAAANVMSTIVKDQEVQGKGKRHPYKGYRNMGNVSELDHKIINIGEAYKSHNQSAAIEIGRAESDVASKENRISGERTTSQWQPKPQAYSGNNNRGSRSDLPPQTKGEGSEVVTQLPGQTVSEMKNMAEANIGHQEIRRERKTVPSRGGSYASNQVPVSVDEPRPASSADGRIERSGVRKNGNQNNRSGRVHEFHGDWSSLGQDNRQHNMSSSRRQNSQYEYQPIGPYNNSKSSYLEGSMEGTHNGPRYRERSQGQSRRGGGNLSGRQSGTARLDGGYE